MSLHLIHKCYLRDGLVTLDMRWSAAGEPPCVPHDHAGVRTEDQTERQSSIVEFLCL